MSFGFVWHVSVAGCLGYDVLVASDVIKVKKFRVSVAGCLGYDVLVFSSSASGKNTSFQLLVY
ncbi:hypothetical protein SPONN_745 [uncultured Candidatus Thioglobus sp.]|nr:hypothetical protein SPONN_745 [uncultured Candidatus Thioglobus sp.]